MPSRTLTLGQGSKMVMDNSYIVPESWTYHSSQSPFIPSPQQSSHQNYFNFSTNATSHFSAEIESSHSEPKVDKNEDNLFQGYSKQEGIDYQINFSLFYP